MENRAADRPNQVPEIAQTATPMENRAADRPNQVPEVAQTATSMEMRSFSSPMWYLRTPFTPSAIETYPS